MTIMPPQLMFEIVMIKSSFDDFPIRGFEIVLAPSSDTHSEFSLILFCQNMRSFTMDRAPDC
jgi:hypothetical protein